MGRDQTGWKPTLRGGLGVAMVALVAPAALSAQSASSSSAGSAAPEAVTFADDIAPILYENCVRCHRPNGVAPMPLITYQQVKPFAPLIKYRTGLHPEGGTMPPYYLEYDVGVQEYKDDQRLTHEEKAKIAAWADVGAPQGDPANMPEAPDLEDEAGWTIDPDIVVESEEIFMEGGAPDWWGDMEPIPIPLEEDRYVRAVEVREINDVPPGGTGRSTVGGRFIVHHMIWSTIAESDEGERTSKFWPVHELGRNPDVFDPGAGQLLKAGSRIVSNSLHLHSNGRDTHAHLQIGFELHPEGYEPKYRPFTIGSLGDGQNIDIRANEDDQELHAYQVLPQHTKVISFEPHLHAPGERMCLEYIWGTHRETLSCVGYDHNWVKQYTFADGDQPLLPKGAILHITAWMNNSETNPNIPDPRNWQGSGNRSVQNMFIDLGRRVFLTDEQFKNEMAERIVDHTKNDQVIGCPLCLATVPTPPAKPVDDADAANAAQEEGQQDDEQQQDRQDR